MKRICLSNLQYLLLALLLAAMIGCGANNAATNGGGVGAVQARVVFPKSNGKMLASVVPTGVGSLKLTVTGTGSDGINPIPVVRSTMLNLTPGADATATVTGIYPGKVTLAVQAMSNLDGTGTVVWEGYAIGVPVAAGASSPIGTINMSTPVLKADNTTCLACHETILDGTGQNLIADYKQSGHYTNSNVYAAVADGTGQAGAGATQTGCAGCHGTQHNDASPSSSGRCYKCHGFLVASHRGNTDLVNTSSPALIHTNNCTFCHQAHNTNAFVGGRCLSCHSVGQNVDGTAGAGSYVNDNTGVRAVTPEFQKNSHHVVGKALTDADCAVCHLEGQKGGIVDDTYHMKDAKVHLRNCNPNLTGNQSNRNINNAAEYTWDPMSPDHTAMDQFCMSCHNSAGAPAAFGIVSSATGRNTATNPFGDTISNSYDGMSRSVVTPVFDQFDTGNPSHHAVRGKKYSGRTRASVTNPGVFTQYSGAAVNPTVVSAYTNGNAGVGPLSPGSRYTIYEAGFFVSNYTPLGAAQTVGDDSTLHCGDCHTVGQWKNGSTTAVKSNTDGTTSVASGLLAIGAHGSNNEYLLRTSDGVDVLHHQSTNVVPEAATGPHGTGFVPPTDGTYVCFLCHSQRVYGAEEYLPFAANATQTYADTRMGGHAGMHPCNDGSNAESTGLTGSARVASHEDGEWGGGNLYGYTCAHCHNAGNKGFGGIHGSKAVWGTYSAVGGYADATHTGVAVTQRQSYRFMGGLSLRYNGGATASTWETQVLQKSNREGCYNFAVNGPVPGSTGTARSALSAAKNEWVFDATGQGLSTSEFTDGANATQTYGTWGSCSHHNGANNAGSGNAAFRKVQRPLTY